MPSHRLPLSCDGKAISRVARTSLRIRQSISAQLSKACYQRLWRHGLTYIGLPPSRDRSATLNAICPAAGAVLRILLLQNATVRLIIDGLRLSGGSANLVDLAANWDRLDHARAPVLFLTPTALSDLQDDQGAIAWRRADSFAYRRTVSYRLKSVLKHAGILAPELRLGGIKHFDATRDLWVLAQSLAVG